tara:strand:+ start:7389 stop:8027 length:639 start_codon:yes stop_codon:yes gene_type:complete
MIKNFYFDKISIIVIWTFHLTGVIGIIFIDREWFISATPLNLIISLVLLLFNSSNLNKTVLIGCISFIIGIFVEILGVNFGLVFGNYVYGSVLGPKLFDVPVLIGYNWALLLILTASIAQKVFKTNLNRVSFGVILMLILDLIMEPVAPILGYWEFSSGSAPLQNYIGWIFVSFPLHLLYHKLNIEKNNNFPNHLYSAQILFFVLLLLIFNQ